MSITFADIENKMAVKNLNLGVKPYRYAYLNLLYYTELAYSFFIIDFFVRAFDYFMAQAFKFYFLYIGLGAYKHRNGYLNLFTNVHRANVIKNKFFFVTIMRHIKIPFLKYCYKPKACINNIFQKGDSVTNMEIIYFNNASLAFSAAEAASGA